MCIVFPPFFLQPNDLKVIYTDCGGNETNVTTPANLTKPNNPISAIYQKEQGRCSAATFLAPELKSVSSGRDSACQQGTIASSRLEKRRGISFSAKQKQQSKP